PGDRETVGSGAFDAVEYRSEAVGIERALHERERQRSARFGDHTAEHRELVVGVHVIGDDLQDALADRAETFGDADQLVGGRGECRRWLTPAGAVVDR